MAPDTPPTSRRRPALASRRSFWPFVALLLLLAFNVLFTRNFGKIEIKRPADTRRAAIALPAADATIHGTQARLEPADGGDHIGNWHRADEWVSWEIEVAEPGVSAVEVTLGCTPGSEGSQYALDVAGQRLVGRVEATRSGADFASRELGTVAIAEAGAYTVSVRLLGRPDSVAMRLRSVVLRPVGPPRLYGSMIDVLHRGSIVMLLATGMTLVIATAGIDLSVGAVMAMAGAVAAMLITGQPPMAVPWAVAIALVVAVAAGTWNGVLVGFLRLQPIVATLILLVAGRGVAQLLTDGQKITIENPAFEFLGGGSVLCLPITVFIVAGLVGLTLLVTKATSVGLYVEAVGNNERASRLCGLRPGLVKTLVYGFSGLCAGMAGLIYTAEYKVADVSQCGLYLELDAILAVVIGGTAFSGGRANVPGSILGALIIQTLTTTILTRGVGIEYTLVVKAVVVVGVCLLQSAEFRSLLLRMAPRRRPAA